LLVYSNFYQLAFFSQLYLIIFDEKLLAANESNNKYALIKDTGYLGQLALLTGGDIIYVPNYAFQSGGEMGYVSSFHLLKK
jgi:hypothetical protein